MEKEDPQWERQEACGRFELDWCCMPSYDYSSEPWRSYIPLWDLWNHHGSQGWVFRKLNPNLSVDPSSPPGLYCLQSKLKSDILLTYRAPQLIISAVTQMYELHMPPQLELLLVAKVDEEYSQVMPLNARIWDAFLDSRKRSTMKPSMECAGPTNPHHTNDLPRLSTPRDRV